MMDIIGDVGKIMVFLLLLLSAFLLTTKATKRLPNSLFAAFLLVTAIDFSGFFLGEWFYAHDWAQEIKMASVALQMPLFFLYVCAVCYHNFRLDWRHLWHAVPFVFILAVFLFLEVSTTNDRWYHLLTKVQYYYYIGAIFYTLYRYKKLQLENYALHSTTYRWLQTTTILFLTGNTLVSLKNIFQTYVSADVLAALTLFVTLFAFSVCCWFVLKTMRSPELFTGIDKHLVPVQTTTAPNPTEHEEELAHLANYMTEHQPYLADDLNLQQLASLTGLPEKQLSLLINRVLGTHFFDYINGYRIEEAQRLLREESELTVQQIMYSVGFNSKSSFYTAFKKKAGQTPSIYRKSAS